MSCSTPPFIYERKAIWTFNLILSFMKQKIYLVSKQQKGLIAFFLFTQFLGFSVDFFLLLVDFNKKCVFLGRTEFLN